MIPEDWFENILRTVNASVTIGAVPALNKYFVGDVNSLRPMTSENRPEITCLHSVSNSSFWLSCQPVLVSPVDIGWLYEWRQVVSSFDSISWEVHFQSNQHKSVPLLKQDTFEFATLDILRILMCRVGLLAVQISCTSNHGDHSAVARWLTYVHNSHIYR